MGCNCGGSFQIDDGLVEGQVPVVGDPSYFHTNEATPGITSDNASLVAPNGTPVWNPDTGKTEREAG